MPSGRRRQLSLYLPAAAAAPIEALRRVLDPVQHRLIPAHVTLCREQELAQLPEQSLAARLSDPAVQAIELDFGRPTPFFEHGWLLACIAGEAQFRALRAHLLGPDAAAKQQPHITLAHPRNPKAEGNTPAAAQRLPILATIRLASAVLIEQQDDEAWQIVWQFELRPRPLGDR